MIQRDITFDKKEMHAKCLEVGVQARAGVGTGLFSRKEYRAKCVWWKLGDFIIYL